MESIKIIFNNIRDKIPQAVVRFNDGELLAITHNFKDGLKVSRGNQIVTKDLSQKLKEALQHRQVHYWIGIPCIMCYPKLYKITASIIEPNYLYLTKAVVFANRNWHYFIKNFPPLIANRNIIYVGGEDQSMDKLKEHTGIVVNQFIPVKPKDAWEDYQKTVAFNHFKEGDIVLLSCGPMSRVLVYEWYKKWPAVTFLDIGSAFDPFTKGAEYSYHSGKLKSCLICN